eukprot:gene48437-7487_t
MRWDLTVMGRAPHTVTVTGGRAARPDGWVDIRQYSDYRPALLGPNGAWVTTDERQRACRIVATRLSCPTGHPFP